MKAQRMSGEQAFCLYRILDLLAEDPCGDFAETLLMLLDRDTLIGIGHPEKAPLELVKAIVAEQPGITKAKLMGRVMAAGIPYHKGQAMIHESDAFRIEKGAHNQTFYFLADESSLLPTNGTTCAAAN
jgi:hypothetical protein